MTKKDYIELGDWLRIHSLAGKLTETCLDHLIMILKKDNTKFNEKKFREYIK